MHRPGPAKRGESAMRRRLLSLTTCALLGATMMASPLLAAPDRSRPAGKEWPVANGDWSNSRYSTLKQINTGNVKQLGAAWQAKIEGASRTNPVVADGVMYLTAGTDVYALNPKTGETLWTFKPEVPPAGLYKGVTVGDGMVFVGLGNGSLIALESKTGEPKWVGNIGDSPAIKGQFVIGAPVYVDGLVIGGLANGDYGIRGRIVALDAKTGKEVWRFNTTAGPGDPGYETWPHDNNEWERGAAGVWVTGAVDKELGLVYFGTGNPIPQWGGELRAGDNLYSDTVLALDIKTGKLRWHYQVVHHDIWEQDLGTPLVLYDAAVDGKPRKALAAMRTDGSLFLLDRATGKPVLPVEERPVPQNAHQKTAPTQPFPVGDSLSDNCVDPATIPAGFKPLCKFDPVDYDTPNAMYPLKTTRSAPLAYSPDTKYFYATGSVWPYWLHRFEDPKLFIATSSVPGIKYSGIIAAIDSRTNRVVWKKKLPYEIDNGSGMTATAGGLLFHGEPDGNFQAYDAKTGDLLWQFQTGGNANVTPTVYEVNGEEHVAVITRNGVWAFRLGGNLPQQPAPPPPPTVTSFSGRTVATDRIQMGVTIRDSGLEKVREAFDEFAIQPLRAKVKAGSKVTFTNGGKEPHEAAAVDGSWTTGKIAPGQSVTITFDKPGTYTYQCKNHLWSYAELTVE
jgi:PQQ-dependent dehydrogenase (methanol/ethanol family)